MTTRSPRISLLMLAYNQEKTVRAAVESCLAQDCEPIEIVLSDDASTDSTFDILQEMAEAYRGPHHVWARRNEKNLGIGSHYNALVEASKGELLFTAAGDDISTRDRVRRTVEAWEATGCKADLVACHVIDLDDNDQLHDVMHVANLGEWRTLEQWSEKRPYIIGAGHAFTRRMMERFGPLDSGVFYEDQIMVFRAIVSGGAVTVDAPLVHYRRGGTSRKPMFESMEHMKRWTARQLGRELAEMHQLIADGAKAGCEAEVRAHLGLHFTRMVFFDAITRATTSQARWQAFREASALPRFWRLRKMLHSTYPHATYAVRRTLGAFHAWRHRMGWSRRDRNVIIPPLMD